MNQNNIKYDTWVAVTTSDTVNIVKTPKAIYADVSGTISMIDSAGTTVSFTVLAGVIYPLVPTRIRATGTTATGIKILS